jgi:hypothetical protein
MSKIFQDRIDQLHDARVFGFLFDNNRLAFEFDFYLYVQIFDDFLDDSYCLKKTLLRFSDAKIDTLIIQDDLSRGQYFISGINVNQQSNGTYMFDFLFSSAEIKLKIHAADFEVITSDKTESSIEQYIKTDWNRLILTEES